MQEFSKLTLKSDGKLRNIWKIKSLTTRDLKLRKEFLIPNKKEHFKNYTMAHPVCLHIAYVTARIVQTEKTNLYNSSFSCLIVCSVEFFTVPFCVLKKKM